MSTPTSHPISPQALAGIKVIELGQLIAGPFAGKTLADFGAEVIKIEPPAVDGAPDGSGGDPLRQWRMLHNGTSVWWQVQSRNKKSVVLDLRTQEGRDTARRLIDEADVVIEAFRPGVVARLGIGYAPEERRLFGSFTVEANMLLPAEVLKLPRPEIARRLGSLCRCRSHRMSSAAAYHRHMMTGKPTQAKVGQRKARYLEAGDAVLVKLMLPYA